MQKHNYQIITTLGPSSNSTQVWESLVTFGGTGFRLNTSHLTLQQLRDWLDTLQSFLATYHLPLILDLQGSKWRLGAFSPYELIEGKTISLIFGDKSDHLNLLPVPHADFFQAATQLKTDPLLSNKGFPEIILSDAKIVLLMETASINLVTARILHGGIITPNKGITIFPNKHRVETLSAKDRAIVGMTSSAPYIRFAISYVKDAVEMEKYRSLLGASTYLIAKLERQSALDDAEEIANIADEIWVCRGDLGAELGLAVFAEQVHQFSTRVKKIPKPVLLAGQVLEHMVEHSTPTRSEICYLYDTLVNGYQGVVLSDETAIGSYPVESCKIAALFTT